jgi:hypothetical protein
MLHKKVGTYIFGAQALISEKKVWILNEITYATWTLILEKIHLRCNLFLVRIVGSKVKTQGQKEKDWGIIDFNTSLGILF